MIFTFFPVFNKRLFSISTVQHLKKRFTNFSVFVQLLHELNQVTSDFEYECWIQIYGILPGLHVRRFVRNQIRIIPKSYFF